METFTVKGVVFASHIVSGDYVWRSSCGRISVGHAYAEREGTIAERRYYWAEVDGRRGTYPHCRLRDAMVAGVGQCRRMTARAA